MVAEDIFMTRVDEDGVPCIVQKIELETGDQFYDWAIVTFFDGTQLKTMTRIVKRITEDVLSYYMLSAEAMSTIINGRHDRAYKHIERHANHYYKHRDI